jgi:hypothetical protein
MGHQSPQDLFGHGRIEPRRGLVEYEQFRAATKRQQQEEFGTHAAREGLYLAVQRQLESTQIALLQVGAPAREKGGGEADHFRYRHVAVEILIIADKGGAASNVYARVLRIGVQSKNAGVTTGGPGHPEQNLDRGCFAGAVATDKPTDGARRHLETQPANCFNGAVVLSQVFCFDDERFSHH